MASPFDPTLLEKAWYTASQSDYMQANEFRKQSYGLIETAFSNQNSLIKATELSGMRTAAQRPTSIALNKRRTTAAGSTRACEESTAPEATAQVPVTWATNHAGFFLSMDELTGANHFDFNSILAIQMSEAIRVMDEKYEAAAFAALLANKSNGLGTLYTRVATDAQVPAADYNLSTNSAALFMNKIKAEMSQNLYSGPYQVIGDPIFSSVVSALLNQGAGNSQNTAFQFQQFGYNFSNQMVNDGGVYASAFVMNSGMFSTATWIKPKNRGNIKIDGVDTGSGSWLVSGSDMWGYMIHPVYGFPIEIKVKTSCYDNSANAAEAQDDLKVSIGLSYDYSFQFGYTSSANTGIYRYELLP